MAVAELADAGCGVSFHCTGFEIEYNGEIIYRDWRCPKTRLWKMNLEDDGTSRIVPDFEANLEDSCNGLIMQSIQWSINSMCECENKQQLMKFYHASLGSYTKHTLYATAKAGYLQECLGLTPEVINKYISVEGATEMGHMRATPAGKQSTTKKRGASEASLQFEAERKEAEADAIATPEQELHNQKTRHIYMTV